MTRELTLASAIHLAAVLPAVVLGLAQLLRPKGTRSHVGLGWAWVAAMAIAAVSSFWVFGSGNRYSAIHLLSLFVLLSLVGAIWSIRRGNIPAHKKFMLGTLLGLMGAGAGALAPGRSLHQLFF